MPIWQNIGLLADEQLRSGDFRGALDLANLGLEFDPHQFWITINHGMPSCS